MKKILFGIFTALTLACFAQTSFADTAIATPTTNTKITYQAKLETIENALHAPKMVKGMGPATNIVVINYTDTSYITVMYPMIYPNQPILSPKTATRITNDSWTGYTEIRLSDGRQIFYVNPYITPQAIISVYVSAGQYVVNITNG